MTGQLRETLHRQADLLDDWPLDLAAIQQAGNRSIRRRRMALAGGVAGVLAVVAGVTLTVGGGHPTASTPIDDPAVPLSYAVGDVIHDGPTRVDVGRKIVSMVSTSQGFVFADARGGVYWEQHGRVQPLRTTYRVPSHLATPRTPLVGSDDGLVAAWWDGTRIQIWPGYVGAASHTIDLSVPRSRTGVAAPSVRAESDGHLLFWNGRSTMIAEVHPLTSTAIWHDAGLVPATSVQDAAGDKLLVRVGDGLAVVTANYRPLDAAGLVGWKPGTDLSGTTPQVSGVTSGDLAPDARHWFTAEDRDVRVYDSSSGHEQVLSHPGFGVAVPYQWLGNDTLAAAGFRGDDESGPVSLLTCRVSTSTCRLTAADIGSPHEIVLPDGSPVGQD